MSPFRWLLPRGGGSLAWTPITAARLMRARRGRLLLIVAERHCRWARDRTGSRRRLALSSGLPGGCSGVACRGLADARSPNEKAQVRLVTDRSV
jgi:hypothetical protein